MATLSTLGGWVAVIALAGGYWYYYSNQAYKNRRLAVKHTSTKTAESRKEAKPKRARKDTLQSGGDQGLKIADKEKPTKKKAASAKAVAPKPQEESYASITAADGAEPETEIDNLELARQLQSRKAGTVLPGKTQTVTKQKSVKQSRAQEKPVAELSSDNATAPSSATGGDADDDQSSLNSPELNAVDLATPVNSGDISDMLEQTSAGPSVLKITEPANPTAPKKAKAPAAFEAVETKKQRQNRKKAEAKKEAREEEEKERKTLLEKQRRTAREAEGRAAKDGSTFMSTKPPAESAWTASPADETNRAKPAEPKPAEPSVQLLDTYEAPASKEADSVARSTESNYSESELAGSEWQKNFSSLPSEEEQTRILIEESDNWKTVKTKERRKKETKPATKENAKPAVEEQNDYGIPSVIARTGPGQKWESTLVHVEPSGEVVEREVELQDSEWEVA